MEDLIRALGSPVVSTIISTTLGIAIGALAAYLRSRKKDADASGQIPPIGCVSAFCKHKEFSPLVPICYS